MGVAGFVSRAVFTAASFEVVLTAMTASPSASLLSSWLATNWMFLHLVCGCVCLPLLLVDARPASGASRRCDWLAMVLAAVYCFHQFEEHGFDVFGRRYPFVFHLAKILNCDLALEGGRFLRVTGSCGLDEMTILYINVYGVMGLFLAPLLLPTKWSCCLVLMNATLIFSNAVLFHLLPALFFWEYNPGLVQSALMNAPLSAWALSHLWNRGVCNKAQAAAAFLINGPGQVVQALGPMVLARQQMLSNAGQHAVLFAVMLVLQPATALFISWMGPTRKKRRAL